MKNYTKQLNKFTAILIMTLFLGSMFYFNPENTTVLTDLQEEKQITEQITDSKLIDDSVNEPPVKSVIDYNQIFQGETIQTDIEFNKQMVDYHFTGSPSGDHDTTNYVNILGLDDSFSDDSSFLWLYLRWTSSFSPSGTVSAELVGKIYCGGSGTLYYQGRGFTADSNNLHRSNSEMTGTYSITSSMLDAQGYLILVLETYYVTSTTFLWFFLRYLDGAGRHTITQDSEDITTPTNIQKQGTYWDYLYFQRSTITNNIRSTYKYNSPTTKTHKVKPPSVTFAKEMNIYYNEDAWTYSSITPYASVTDTGGVLTINSPTEIDYEILFLSTCQNHLAIKDVSTSFLSDVGFEGSTDIYTNWASNPFETFETSTEQSFAGYSSLKTVQNSGTYGISYVLLSNDYYYVSCWAYIDSITGGAETVSIAWWNGTAWNHEYFDDTLLDRWQNLQFYMQIIDDDSGRNFQFYVSATTATVYFDYESLLFQTSTTIKTTQSSKYESSSTLISWDGYKNPVIPFVDVELELWDRTAQTLEHSYTVRTDEFGHGTITHLAGLEQKEYEIRTYTLDSYFGSEQTQSDVTDSLTDWSLRNEDAGTETASCVDSTIIYEFRESGSSNWELQYNPSANFDISSSDIMYYSYRSNVSTEVGYKLIRTDSSNSIINQTDNTFTAGTIYHMKDFFHHSDWAETGTFDDTEVDVVFLREKPGSTTGWIKVEIFDFRFINAQKLYFTPETFSETPTLIETDTSFYLSSTNNTNQYEIYLDENYLGLYTDLQTILKNNTVGDHNLTYVLFSAGEERAYLSSSYEYLYTVEASAFSVSVENFYLSDDYANLFVTSNYNCSYEITSGGTGSGNIAKEGTTISVTRITTPGSEVTLTLEFTYGSETVTFTTRYNNPVSAFYVSSYTVEIGEENVEIIWSTSKSTIDSLTVYEDGSLTTVDADTTSPSAWAKSSTIGVHYVTLIFSAAGFQDIIYSFNYEIVSAIFEINIESFHLSELYVNTYITASENGNYQVYENNTAIPSDSPTPFFSIGTSIQTDRDTTEGAFINYAIKFWNAAEDTIWFNTTYSNTEGVFFVTSYSVNIGDTTITVTWATSLTDSDKLTVYEDGALTTVNEDTTSPSAWTKSTVVGTHSVTLLFEADGYTTVAYSFNYHIYAVADFQVDIGSFQVSDNFVNTYASANYDGSYYVYEDNEQIETGTLYGSGTVIETNKNITTGITIAYAVKFVYESTEIWFNTTYSNPRTPFYLTDYRVTDGSNITITWDTTLPALDSLTIYEDGMLIEDSDPESTTTWVKNTTVGNHYVTLIFSAAGYDDIIHSFSYSVYPPIAFSVYVESFYVSDDYLNLYATATYDYTYIVYQNDIDIGSGSGMAVGTIIISPKSREAGLYNFTIVFTYGAEDISFMTWYSNLIPPPEPVTDIYREQSEGYFNISLMTNLDHFWIDIYHDSVLIVDDSTLTEFAILKNTQIGYHFIQLVLIYNCSTDAEGYPVAEYNQTVTYPVFYYETVLFYDCQIRYTERIYGIAIPEIDVDSVLTYLDGVLVDTLNYTSVIQDHSNYSYILNNRLWIHNSARNHTLVVRDLFDNLIYNTTIDVGIIQSMTIELPLEKLYVINLDDDDRLIKIRPYLSGLDWDTDSDDLITMILGQYESKSYWVIDSTYECRIYKKVETVSDGVIIWYWVQDPSTEPPPQRVPFSIEIDLESDDDDDTEKTWWDKVVDFFVQYWFYIVLAVVLIALIIAFNAVGNAIVKKQEEQLKQHKKTSLMAETVLQLLYAGKYERLKGFEKRGKEK